MNNQWVEWVVSFLANGQGAMGLIAKLTIFLSIAWGFHFLLRFANPQWRVQLWRFTGLGAVALIGLLLTVPLPQVAVPIQLPAVAPHPRVETKPAAAPPKPVEQPAGMNAVNPAVSISDARVPVEPRAFPWTRAVLVIWLAGVGLGLARLWVGLVRLRVALKKCADVPDGVRTIARRIEKRVGLHKPVTLRKSAEIQSPVLVWWGKSVLLLPDNLCSAGASHPLSAVLGHELTHVRSRDLFWNGFSRLSAMVLWFHPLVWRMRRAHMEACELVADAEAAKLLGDADAYQGVVAEIALSAHASGSLMGGLAFVWKSNVRQRLERLPRTLRQSPVRRKWLGAALVLAVATVIFIAGSVLEARHHSFGIIRLPSGDGAAGARLYVVTREHGLEFRDGLEYGFGGCQTSADTEGRAKFPVPKGSYKLVVLHNQGTVTLTRKEWEAGAPLTIQPWGRVEGRMMIGGKPAANEQVQLVNLPVVKSSGTPCIEVDWRRDTPVVTDAEGRFAFDRVAPGAYQCSRLESEMKWFVMPGDAVRIAPGKSTHVDLKMSGKTLVGRLDWSAMRDQPVRKEPLFIREVLDLEDRLYHRVFDLDPEERAEASDLFWNSNEGLASMRKRINVHLVDVDESGTFRAEHVKPGTYTLSVWAHPPIRSGVDPNKQLGGAQLVFEVPASGANGVEVDVGTVRIVPNRAERLSAGDPMPNLKFKLPNGEAAELKDYLGAPMLVSFGGRFYNPDYFAAKISGHPDVRVVQLRQTHRGSKVPEDPRFTSGYVENGGQEAGYLLGMGGAANPEAYLINDKGTVLKKANPLEALLPFLMGTETIDGEKNASPARRFFVNTEFCIVKEGGGPAGNIMTMAEGRGMNILTVSNTAYQKNYRMEVRYVCSRAGKDLYQIEMQYPGGSETVEVEYAGQELELHRDELRTMLLRPKSPYPGD